MLKPMWHVRREDPVAITDVIIKIVGEKVVAIDGETKLPIAGPSTDHKSVLMKAFEKNIVFIKPGTYSFDEIEISDVVIYASPFVVLDGRLIIGGNVYIYGFPKVSEIDLSRASDYYIEVDVV